MSHPGMYPAFSTGNKLRVCHTTVYHSLPSNLNTGDVSCLEELHILNESLRLLKSNYEKSIAT